MGKPVIVGGTSNRGVVSACSYEARNYGVRSAMPMQKAIQLCPHAIVLKGNLEQYSYYSKLVTEIIKSSVPLFEKTSIDEFYIDYTGMDRFFGCYKVASELRQKIISESGLPISFGMSVNKTVSKIATGEAKPNNQIEVKPGEEKAFLAPLPVAKIPMIGAKMKEKLQKMGIVRIETLQNMSLDALEESFGNSGKMIWRKANGICNSAVNGEHERKSISKERTFGTDIVDVDFMHSIIISLVEKLCFQLRKEQKLSACVNIKIRYADFSTFNLQKQIAYTSLDHELQHVALELFNQLYKKELSVRLIGVKFSHLVGCGHQINLFDNTIERIQLYETMDKIKTKYGSSILKKASTISRKK
tara:strand:- start:32234 stop:33310 length:1077 start_codon:yes stop_codon:yes gene_type:complete